MSCYLVKGKGWRYDFTNKGIRMTGGWFKTKTQAKQAAAKRREELKNPIPQTLEAMGVVSAPTDMGFLDLVNLRLDHVQSYNSATHYQDVRYHCRRWIKQWKSLTCGQISSQRIEGYLKTRRKVSAHVANKELQYLRALFNYGIKKGFIETNPTKGIDFFPVERRRKYIPPKEDVIKVISCGNPEAQQYLWTIVLTAARVNEINALTWDDIDFDRRLVRLWTRKRKGGNRESRQVPMTQMLFDILSARHKAKDASMPWVYWHTYRSRKGKQWVKGPYQERKLLMASLCKKAQVKYFRFHALRHLTASMLDDLGTPIGLIQRILGHQNRRTTEIYLHTVGEAERDAMAKLENTGLFQSQGKMVIPELTNMPTAYWNRKVDRPSFEVLKTDIAQLGYLGTGRKYGVSDNAIRKWVSSYQDKAPAVGEVRN